MRNLNRFLSRSLLASLLFVAALYAATSCEQTELSLENITAANATVALKGLPDSLVLAIGEAHFLRLPKGEVKSAKKDGRLSALSSDDSVVEVADFDDTTVTMLGIKSGEVTVRIDYIQPSREKVSKNVNVRVSPHRIRSFYIPLDTLSMTVGKNIRIPIVSEPASAPIDAFLIKPGKTQEEGKKYVAKILAKTDTDMAAGGPIEKYLYLSPREVGEYYFSVVAEGADSGAVEYPIRVRALHRPVDALNCVNTVDSTVIYSREILTGNVVNGEFEKKQQAIYAYEFDTGHPRSYVFPSTVTDTPADVAFVINPDSATVTSFSIRARYVDWGRIVTKWDLVDYDPLAHGEVDFDCRPTEYDTLFCRAAYGENWSTDKEFEDMIAAITFMTNKGKLAPYGTHSRKIEWNPGAQTLARSYSVEEITELVSGMSDQEYLDFMQEWLKEMNADHGPSAREIYTGCHDVPSAHAAQPLNILAKQVISKPADNPQKNTLRRNPKIKVTIQAQWIDEVDWGSHNGAADGKYYPDFPERNWGLVSDWTEDAGFTETEEGSDDEDDTPPQTLEEWLLAEENDDDDEGENEEDRLTATVRAAGWKHGKEELSTGVRTDRAWLEALLHGTNPDAKLLHNPFVDLQGRVMTSLLEDEDAKNHIGWKRWEDIPIEDMFKYGLFFDYNGNLCVRPAGFRTPMRVVFWCQIPNQSPRRCTLKLYGDSDYSGEVQSVYDVWMHYSYSQKKKGAKHTYTFRLYNTSVN